MEQAMRVGVTVLIGGRPDGAADQAADYRAANSEQRSQKAAHRISTGHYRASKRADDQADYQ
jgi:hypothetical protein